MTSHRFDHVDETWLRQRRSAKWTLYPSDVLPAWVAEMDFPLAEPIRQALCDAVQSGDTGYASCELGSPVAGWLKAQWDLRIDPSDVFVVPDVVTGIREILRIATAPGDSVVIEPPVYPPFAGAIRSLERRVVNVPLLRTPGGWATDLANLERAYAEGARVHVLCSPHNPSGLVLSARVLEDVAALASRYDVLVIADEIHAPLTLPGATHTPMLASSEAARRCSLLLTSASKAWNVAGLKAAVIVAMDGPARRVLGGLPKEISFQAGHFGVLATRVAFAEGGSWLSEVVAILDRNRRLLADLLASELPGVVYLPPQAGYLAWLDCRALALGDDPAQAFLRDGRVALSSGPTFGVEGIGHARLNFATSRSLLEEAVRRMRSAVMAAPRDRV